MFKVGCQSMSLEFPILQESHYQQPLAHQRPGDASVFCVCMCKKKTVCMLMCLTQKATKKAEGGTVEKEEYLHTIGHHFVESQLLTRLQGAVLLVMNTAASPVYVY